MARTARELSGLFLCFLLPGLVATMDPAIGNSSTSSQTEEEDDSPPLGRFSFLLETDSRKEVSVVSQGENSTNMVLLIK